MADSKEFGPNSTVRSALEGKRVVIADRNGMIVLLVRNLLKREGALIVAHCVTVQETIDVVGSQDVDLVLVGLPTAEDPEIVAAVRQSSLAHAPYVILMADSVSAEDEGLLIEAGAAGIIRKPFLADELMKVLLSCCL